MDNILSSQWKKIVAAVILLAAVAFVSSAITYRLAVKPAAEVAAEINDENTEEVLEDETENTGDAEFLEAAESLREQARAVAGIEEWQGKTAAVNNIGEKLKELIISDYSGLISNDTFNSDEFSVSITDYPLEDGRSALRKIEYAVTAGYNMRGSFLQYCGESVFFSDVEDVWSYYKEQDFQVLENADGWFAFALSGGYIGPSFNSAETMTEYRGTVYTVRDNKIIAEPVEIPVRVPESADLQLIVDGNDIKAGFSVYNSPECLFNSREMVFEAPKMKAEGVLVDYDFPGLLLGLSDSEGSIRTLFIRREDGRIKVNEYLDRVIFSKKNELSSLEHYVFEEDFYEDDYRVGSLNIKKLVCVPLGADSGEVFSITSEDVQEWEFNSHDDVPLYVGEDYICYIQNSYHSGGGSFHLSYSGIRFDKLDNLSNYDYFSGEGWLQSEWRPDFKEINLAELLYGEKAENFYQPDVFTYSGKQNSYIDFRQLSLKRNVGKWSVMLPVKEDYFHPGNGSQTSWIKTFAVYSNDVPEYLLSKEEVIELGGWNNWNAKDLFAFPGSDAALFQFDYFIGIGDRDFNSYDPEEYDLTIPVDIDEYIVSISFADAEKQEAWTEELKSLPNAVSNE